MMRRMRTPIDLPFRQVHLDFHTSEHIDSVGADFDPIQFQEALRAGNVDSITVFAKCHHGWSYYPTKVGAPHPHLARPDLLGEQIKACAEIGIAAPVYITVQWDERTAREHPEWRVMRADGGPGQDQLSALWHPLCLSNTGVVDQIIAHAEELIELYDPVGFFFDILLPWQCVCPNCVAKMQAEGRNPEAAEDRLANHRDLIMSYYERVSQAVWKRSPRCRVFHNSGHIPKGERERWAYFSHLELESLPTGGWGWDHFPLSARYAATLGMEFLGMTGKFHTLWGEFGGYKTETSLIYECASMAAQGGRCSVGDQLHPRGRMDLPTYRRLGAAYARVKRLEPYVRGAKPCSELAIFPVEASEALKRKNGERGGHSLSGQSAGYDSDVGAVRVLLEGHRMFDLVDGDSDFSRYKALLLPDAVVLDPATASKLRSYVDAGGALILSGSSGMDYAERSFLLDIGAEYEGRESRFRPDYLEAGNALLNSGTAGSRLVESPFVMYERAKHVKAGTAEVLAKIREPYFNRTWDAFCSHQHAPARLDVEASYDGVLRRGRMIYFSHPIFGAYAKVGQPLYRDLVLAALDLLYPSPNLLASLPSGARATLQRQDEAGRTILHLLYAPAALRGSNHPVPGATNRMVEIVEDAAPLFDIDCSVRLAAKPKRVHLVMAGEDLPFEWKDSRASFRLPRLHVHEAVVME